MPDYSQGKVYKLVTLENDLVYVGSTCGPLSARKAQHMSKYRQWQNGKSHYYTSFEVCRYDSCQIVLVEDFPCERKDQLHARELHWIQTFNCVNKCNPGAYKNNPNYHAEYYETNKDSLLEYYREYYELNRDSINEKKREYRATNRKHCEFCNTTHTPQNFARHQKTQKHLDNVAATESN